MFYLVKYQLCLRREGDVTNVTHVTIFVMLFDVTKQLGRQNIFLAVAATSELRKPGTQVLGLKKNDTSQTLSTEYSLQITEYCSV
jgi:hypothetical protein